MFKNIYIKKLSSLNPDKYEFITLNEAIHRYGIYCLLCGEAKYIKSFQEWLETEI